MDQLQTQITTLLSAVGEGDAQASERLWRIVYDELHRLAKARMAHEGRRDGLQTTVLVQEAFVRLAGREGAAIPANRRHFFTAAANVMRQFLVDHARKRESLKRGGGHSRVHLADEPADLLADPAETIAIDEALQRLAAHDSQMAEIVQLRYFTGLTIDETAAVMEISPRQVDKQWRFAKAWLHRELA
ncbi:ECF-type sigma factor [uncultured Ilyobacter sp.]|uniref:ECF-type sigma factor n=1 Tax=uncultured Ilyobacter sp. TaxID=544433 RepID=UPI0029F4C13C|nr:ECF-type sigma factor [uncultured Ilyobacter sp.]